MIADSLDNQANDFYQKFCLNYKKRQENKKKTEKNDFSLIFLLIKD